MAGRSALDLIRREHDLEPPPSPSSPFFFPPVFHPQPIEQRALSQLLGGGVISSGRRAKRARPFCCCDRANLWLTRSSYGVNTPLRLLMSLPNI